MQHNKARVINHTPTDKLPLPRTILQSLIRSMLNQLNYREKHLHHNSDVIDPVESELVEHDFTARRKEELEQIERYKYGGH